VRGDTDKSYTRVDADDYSRRQAPVQPASKAYKKGCTRCGKFPTHSHNQCPAQEAVCYKYGKKGHYQSMFKSKTNLSAVQADMDSDDSFLGAIDKVST